MSTTDMPHATATFLSSPEFLAKGLPFSEMVQVGNLLYLSGQMGTLPGTQTLASGGTQGQARQALQNIQNALQAQGHDMANVIKCTVMLADMADWADFNTVYTEFFKPPYPARSAFGTSGLAFGGRLEVEVVAVANTHTSEPREMR